MISSALEDLAQMLLEEGKPLRDRTRKPRHPTLDLIRLTPLSVEVGAGRTVKRYALRTLPTDGRG